MAKEVSLDAVMLSEAAVAAWHEMAGRFAVALQYIGKMRGKEIPIPDERARVNDNGTLTIFVSIPGTTELTMDVPADHWSYRQ